MPPGLDRFLRCRSALVALFVQMISSALLLTACQPWLLVFSDLEECKKNNKMKEQVH